MSKLIHIQYFLTWINAFFIFVSNFNVGIRTEKTLVKLKPIFDEQADTYTILFDVIYISMFVSNFSVGIWTEKNSGKNKTFS